MATKPSMAGQGLGLLGTFINGVRSILESTYGKTVHNLERMADPRLHQIVAAYLAGLPVTIGKAVQETTATSFQLTDRTISLTINLNKTVAQLIADGRYTWINIDIPKLFKLEPTTGTLTQEILLLRYNKNMSSQAVTTDMERQGLRPATFLELLWIGIQHPLLQLEFPIVALGSVVELSGSRRVAVLGCNNRERDLDLGWFVADWFMDYHFAAVRLPAQAYEQAA